MLTDEEFVRALEAAALPAGAFDHAAHVRVARRYLRQYSLGEAIGRFRRSVRAFAEAHGASGKRHETMTVAWMLLISERLNTTRHLDWPDFATRHPELFGKPSLLTWYYSSETFASEQARRNFVKPDLSPVSGTSNVGRGSVTAVADLCAP